MATTTGRRPRVPVDTSPLNDVHLRGRVSATPVVRELPSGDAILVFRLVVDRPPRTATAPTSARVDTLDCTAFKADLRRRCAAWGPGDVVEVRGSLRRRFFRAGGAPASRYEVEVLAASRVAKSTATGRATMTG